MLVAAGIAGVGAQQFLLQQGGRGAERKLLAEFDLDKSGWLNSSERKAARGAIQKSLLERLDLPKMGGSGGPGFPGFGGPAGPGRKGGPGRPGASGPGGPGAPTMPEAKTGPSIDKDSVSAIAGELYDPAILRTIFIDFEDKDWEQELEDFHNSDVDVAATVTVDGKSLPNCGIRFRGASSYVQVPDGHKRSLNVSVDMVDEDQRLLGYKTLNLLNGHGDESFMSTVLYAHVARQYMPAPKANFVRVVINGEYWGVYANVQQFDKQFLEENYGSKEGARWKVHGSPRGGGGLDYRGDDPAAYRHPYEQKSGGDEAQAKLIELCKILDQTPADKLPALLEPICDVDQLLWFLAIDVGLMNSDGYWVRASDYNIYLDKNGKFHFIPHDMNEAFRPPRGGAGGLRRGGPGSEAPGTSDPLAASGQSNPLTGLDPLTGLTDAQKPLRSKVLAVPKYREQYLNNLKTLTEKSLNWESLGPFVTAQASLISESMKSETRGLASYEIFAAATSDKESANSEAPRFGPPRLSIREFIDGRHSFLNEYMLKASKP